MSVTRVDVPEGFGDRVRSAVFWRSGSQIASQMVTWTATIMVVRILEPQDYGLFAMTQVILVLLNFLNGYSFASSLIQAEEIDEKRIGQVFGLLILLNGALAAIQLISAPLVADYFRQPVIADMLRVQSLLYLATPLIALNSALLARSLDFRNQAISNLAGAFTGAITALLCARSGLGLWTLVYAPLAIAWVRAIGLTVIAGRLPRPRFTFDGAGRFFQFGGILLLCQLFWIVQSQADIFLAGRHFDPHDLGLYSEAVFITLIFTSRFLPAINEVAFPAYAELIKSGGDVARAFATTVKLVMLAAMPLYVGLSLVAGPLVATVFGPKWTEMAPLASGLAIAMPCFVLQIICSPVTNGLGRPKIYLTTSIAGAVIMAAAFVVGINWGLNGLIHAWQIGMPLLLLITLALTLPAIGARWSQIGTALLPSLSASAIMGLSVFGARHMTQALSAPVQLITLIAIGVAVYGVILWRFAPQTSRELIAMLTRRKLQAS
jgi:O-antigen/teichoic acid export membrane protein